MTVFQKKNEYFTLKQGEYLRDFYSGVGREKKDRWDRENSLKYKWTLRKVKPTAIFDLFTLLENKHIFNNLWWHQWYAWQWNARMNLFCIVARERSCISPNW